MSRRILLIEDEPLSQDIITSLLRGQGYEVDVAMDGFAALDRARAVRYEVALVDYHLPEMDGYALGRLLREQHPGDAGPVLIGLTADRNGLAARRGSDAVFRAILPKPIKPAELFSTIERLCETAGPDAPGEAEPADPRRIAAALWRSHGLAASPKALACPPPTAEQAAALTLCFELVEPAEAHCIVLLERHGINEALRIAKRSQGKPLPIVGLSADHTDICDSLFRVDDPASWKALAATLGAEAAPMVVVTLPTPQPACEPTPEPAPEATLPAAVAAPVIPAAPMPQEQIAPEIRQLLLSGVRTPLDRLRRDLAAQQRMIEPAGQRQVLLDQLASLDAMLLVAGTIADALNPAAPRIVETETFDPAEMAENALAMIRDSLPPGSVRVSCRIADGLPRLLRGDAHRLSQAVLTLLDDACAGQDPVALTLRLGFEADKSALTLHLAQAEAQGEAEPRGVVALLRNLRLTMLARLVGLMGGTLTRQDGEVRLSVPAVAEADAPRLAADGEAVESAPILLIDDGATSGQLLTLLLTQKGHRVCRVGDGEAALFACRDARHDLVIFDLASGEEARRVSLDSLRRFRTARADVPALVLANAFSAQEEAQLRGWGIAALLAKPFSPEALGAAVAACLAKRAEPTRPAVIDAAVRDALANALGSATVERLTGQLLAQIEPLCSEPVLSDEAKTRLVELSGCACVLGLAELAAQCTAPTGGVAIGAALQRLRANLSPQRSSAA
jgi:DNA-binding response OmpR family regulator